MGTADKGQLIETAAKSPKSESPSTLWSGRKALIRRAYMTFLVCMSFFLVFAGMFFQWLEDRDLSWFHATTTHLYAVMQVVTTIGYGDITPETQRERAGYTIYIICLLALVAYGVSLGQDWAVQKSKNQLEKRLKEFEEGHGAKRNLPMDFFAAAGLWIFMVMLGTVFFCTYESCSCGYGRTKADNESCLEWPADVPYEVCVASGGQVKTFIDALYFSVVTMTTVGFGDLSPQTPPGRIFAIVWALFGVAITAYFITQLSDEIFTPLKEKSAELSPEDALDIDRKLFDEIDTLGNGVLTRMEYMEYVLVKHDVCTKRVLALINKKFDALDTGGTGEISWEEIAAVRGEGVGTLESVENTDDSDSAE